MTPFDESKWLYEGAHVGGAQLAGAVLAPVEACGTHFERMVLAGATLRRWVLEDCRITASDLSNAVLVDTAFESVRFEGCKLVGVDFTVARAMTFAARFVDCSLRLARFGGMSLRDVRFEGCDLRDVDFAEADCRGVRFTDCDLTGALFEQTDLRSADLATARGVQLDPLQNRVHGTIIGPAVAIALAERQGFEVRR